MTENKAHKTNGQISLKFGNLLIIIIIILLHNIKYTQPFGKKKQNYRRNH